MLPNAEYAPACIRQHTVSRAVSCDIARDFSLPVAPVGLWHAQVQSAAVPEATIYKKGKPLAAKQEIRLSGQGLIAPPSPDSVRSQY